jgi:protein-S-isoprenylcysteine O-methyltransferase Ste14
VSVEARLRAAAVARYRVARPTSRRRLAAKTGIQIVAVWGFALGLLPAAAVQVDRRLGLPRLRWSAKVPIGAALFALGSAVGLHAAYCMAETGHGTPIPFDAARDLVVVGPYRIVRNPMAVSAITQSAGIALALGSPTAALIPPAGALVWNRFIRPSEEDFLVARFGRPYREYQRAVRCWVPTWPPYALPAACADADVAPSGLPGGAAG